MQIVLSDSREASKGLWLTQIPPHQLGMFGTPNASRGKTSVLLVTQPEFDDDNERLTLDPERVLLLNVGSSSRTLVIDADGGEISAGALRIDHQGPGDREYRELVDIHLKGEAREAAHALLAHVRKGSPGDLKRGGRNNFSNTPDNFWYVIVQPRSQSLSITVRGEPEKFEPTTLAVVADRPGYTRFQLRSLDELEEAQRLIAASNRKSSRLAFLRGASAK